MYQALEKLRNQHVSPTCRELLVTREKLRQKPKSNFDHHHRVRDLSPVLSGDFSMGTDKRERGIIGDQASPRSYQVDTLSGNFRRNRRDIIPFSSEGGCPILSAKEPKC